jgi:hypothetical protein
LLASTLVLQSLDFLYVPTGDVDAAADGYVEQLDATLVWRVKAMGTTVACLRVSEPGPLVLLSGHLDGEQPILVYRVEDYGATVGRLRAAGVDLHELEIPHGPCASFRAPGGQRLAVYELTRPGANDYFTGRLD